MCDGETKTENVLEKKNTDTEQHRHKNSNKIASLEDSKLFTLEQKKKRLKAWFRATSTQPTARSFAYSLVGEENHDTKALFKKRTIRRKKKCANYRKMTKKYLGCWITQKDALCSLKFDESK